MKRCLLLLALVFIIIGTPAQAQNNTMPLGDLTPQETNTGITNPALPFDANSGAPVSPNAPVAPVQGSDSNLPDTIGNPTPQPSSNSTFTMPNTDLQITIPGASQPSPGVNQLNRTGGNYNPNFSGSSSGVSF